MNSIKKIVTSLTVCSKKFIYKSSQKKVHYRNNSKSILKTLVYRSSIKSSNRTSV